MASARFRSGHVAMLTGVAKGSGMIHPQLATMLVYLCTDAQAGPGTACSAANLRPDLQLHFWWTESTSSNVAKHKSAVSLHQSGVRKQFAAALLQVCQSLAEQIVADGEGVQHVICLFVEQARSRPEALQVAEGDCLAPQDRIRRSRSKLGPYSRGGRLSRAADSSDQLDIVIGKRRPGTPQAGAHQDLAQPQLLISA